MILCSNPHFQYLAHKAEIDAAVKGVLESGWYVLGEQVKGFEREFAMYVGVGHAIGVGSGTEALHVALAACGVGPGDEVITVSHTAVATVTAIELCGASPVLVDIDPTYYTMDPLALEKAIGPKVKAIIPVHLYGQPADLTAICEIAKRHGIRVIEDCAQAHGARHGERRCGAWGDLACFSFYPTKNLGALGDGGAVVSNDADLARQVGLLREYGWATRYVSHIVGWNTRLDEIQAAILRVKLRYLDADNARRVQIAANYSQALANSSLELPRVRTDGDHVFHLYVARSSRRNELLAHLRGKEVGAAIHYPVPVHLQPAYRDRLRGHDGLAETERAALEVISLPIYPELDAAQQQQIIAAVESFPALS